MADKGGSVGRSLVLALVGVILAVAAVAALAVVWVLVAGWGLRRAYRALPGRRRRHLEVVR